MPLTPEEDLMLEQLRKERDEAICAAEILDEAGMDANDKLAKLCALIENLNVGTPYGSVVKAYARFCLNKGADPFVEGLTQSDTEGSAQALIEMCEAALHKVEWGDADRPHQAYCPVCARSERGGHYREVCMALAAIEAHKKGEGA